MYFREDSAKNNATYKGDCLFNHVITSMMQWHMFSWCDSWFGTYKNLGLTMFSEMGTRFV